MATTRANCLRFPFFFFLQNKMCCLQNPSFYEITRTFTLFLSIFSRLFISLFVLIMKSPKSNQIDEKIRIVCVCVLVCLCTPCIIFIQHFAHISIFYSIFSFCFGLQLSYSSTEAKIAQHKFTLLLIYKILC